MVIYVTNCPEGSCELTKDQLRTVKTISANNKTSNRDGCPEHGGIVIQRKSYCYACGKEFYMGLQGAVPDKCKPCSTRAHRKYMKLQRQKIAIEKNKIHTARGDYCKDMLNCLKKDQFPACLDCNKFYPIFRGVDPGRMEQWTV
jgi:hypothetical protein